MLSHHHQVMKPKLMQIPLFYLTFIADVLLEPIQIQNQFKFQFFRWHWWHVLGVGQLAVARSAIVTRWTWNDMKLVQLVLPLLWQWQCMWALPARFMPKVYYLLVCFRIVLMIIWPSVPPALGRTSVTVSGYTFGSSFGAILKMTWFLRINRDCMDL